MGILIAGADISNLIGRVLTISSRYPFCQGRRNVPQPAKWIAAGGAGRRASSSQIGGLMQSAFLVARRVRLSP